VPVRPSACIDAPANHSRYPAGTLAVAGVAWAPPAGVAAVEIRVDDRPWQPADLAVELAPAAWRRWRADVHVPTGHHRVQVRCVDRTGRSQDGSPADLFPSGAGGYHTIDVEGR
jgi:hypothetical protein